jgi:alpha-glucoside transport system substrate-binding protein
MLHAIAAGLALAGAPAAAQDLLFPPGEDERFDWEGFEAFGAAHPLAGERLVILGPWTGADATLVQNVLAYFAEATGADAVYNGSGNFEQDVVVAVNAGTPPDIAVIAQPGLAADLAAKGFLSPLGQETADWIAANYAAGDSWVDLATFTGPDGAENLYGVFYKVDVKSLVWFVPEQFEEAGYEIPETMEELKALTELIVEDGGTPWCIGLGSGDATGWPATDWVEDMMLRVNPPEVYDQWVTNAIPFTDPQVVAAIEEYGWFAREDAFVRGGAAAAATTDFRDSPSGLFAFPPECYMHKQATFIPTFFPEGIELGVDADFFYFPAYAERDLGKPVLGAGTMWTITRDSPAARAFIEFLKTPIAHEVWMAQSGFTTPYRAANPEAYANETARALGEVLTGATTFRFDGSDLMPGEVGTSAFWRGMVDYTTGAEAASVAQSIQARWDTLK